MHKCNVKNLIFFLIKVLLILFVKTELTIPKNLCDKGLTIYYFGSTLIKENSRIGEN